MEKQAYFSIIADKRRDCSIKEQLPIVIGTLPVKISIIYVFIHIQVQG